MSVDQQREITAESILERMNLEHKRIESEPLKAALQLARQVGYCDDQISQAQQKGLSVHMWKKSLFYGSVYAAQAYEQSVVIQRLHPGNYLLAANYFGIAARLASTDRRRKGFEIKTAEMVDLNRTAAEPMQGYRRSHQAAAEVRYAMAEASVNSHGVPDVLTLEAISGGSRMSKLTHNSPRIAPFTLAALVTNNFKLLGEHIHDVQKVERPAEVYEWGYGAEWLGNNVAEGIPAPDIYATLQEAGDGATAFIRVNNQGQKPYYVVAANRAESIVVVDGQNGQASALEQDEASLHHMDGRYLMMLVMSGSRSSLLPIDEFARANEVADVMSPEGLNTRNRRMKSQPPQAVQAAIRDFGRRTIYRTPLSAARKASNEVVGAFTGNKTVANELEAQGINYTRWGNDSRYQLKSADVIREKASKLRPLQSVLAIDPAPNAGEPFLLSNVDGWTVETQLQRSVSGTAQNHNNGLIIVDVDEVVQIRGVESGFSPELPGR